MGSAAIFAGSTVKVLKQILSLNGVAYVLAGTVDPTVTAQIAPAGSIYLYNGNAYVKQDSGTTTNWSRLPTQAALNYLAPKAPADGFSALVSERFDTTSKVNSTNTTGSFVPNGAGGYYALSCDKTKTVTTSGANYTLNGAPGFTVTPGCIIYFSSFGVFRRIATVTSQTTGTLDAAPPSTVTGAACMVSQAIWTNDLVNFGDSTQLTRLRDYFPSTAIQKIHVEYLDSSASGDQIPDSELTATVVVVATNNGLQTDTTTFPTTDTWTAPFTRSSDGSQALDYPLAANANQQRLFLCFFPNPSNGSVVNTANLLGYDCSLYAKTAYQNGGTLNSAYTMSDGSGTEVNCAVPVYNSVTGYTRITLTWNYTPGLNSGMPDGDLEVIVEGQVIPRQFTGVVGSYYIEVAGTTNAIDILGDLTSLTPAQSIHIRRRQGITDTSAQNALRLLASYDAIVGSANQVATGEATHSSIQSAVTAMANASARILVLPGTYTENVNLAAGTNDNVVIHGKGRGCILSGNLIVNASYCDLSLLQVTGSLSLTGGGNFVKAWIGSAGSFSDTGSGNDARVIQG